MGQNIFRATNATLLIEKVQPTNQGFYTVVISNIAGSVLSADGGLKVLPPLNCTPAPADMISWWPADNTHADAVDGNNATANFPPIILNPFGPGKINQAFNLNGSGARLQVAGSPSLSFGSNANFTIEGWIKAFPTNGAPLQSQTYPNVPLIERRSSSGLAGVGFSLSLNQGRLAFWLATNTTVLTANSVMFISSGPDLRDGMFHHVAVSVNRTQTNSAVLCVDGNAVLTFDLSSRRGPLTNSTVGMMFIGGPTTTLSNSFFFGLIDELTMYSRALSAAEIQAIAGAGSAGKCRVPPSIVQQPADQTINSGAPASFSVVATGSPNLRFQWFRVGGSALPGATNATAILTGVTNTSQYFVRVTNFWGSVISSNATLTVLPPPPGVPANGTLQFDLNAGQPHLLFSGYPGQSYLVEASTNLIDWEVIGSATDLGNGSFEFFDPNWTNYNACFYRVVQP
jgi:hypothetical protein